MNKHEEDFGDLRVKLKTVSTYFDPTYFHGNGALQIYDENTSVDIELDKERVLAHIQV